MLKQLNSMKNGKVLALDYGTRRVGVASGDLEMKIAFPREIIRNNGDVLQKVLELAKELGVCLIVIGLPLSMDEGQGENPIMVDVRALADGIRKGGFEVEFVDERLSSFEAAEMTGMSGLGKAEKLDAHAAQIILQRYFDGL